MENENEDLLGGETVEPETPVVETPAEPADVSPEVNTEGVKSVAEAIDFGLGEVDARRAGKKPDADKPVETDEEKAAREAEEAANSGKTPEELAAAKAAADAKAKDPAAKEKSAVDDPIPPQVAEKTRERMQTLIDLVKDKDGQIAQHQQFVDQIAATGATPPEFTTMMSYLTAVHSDNPDHLRLAQKLLLSELQGISLKLGEAAPGVDFLKDFPDLLTKVDRGEMRREDAQETALNRARAKAAETQRAATAAQDSETAKVTKARTDAQVEMTTLGDELHAKHGAEYLRRYAILEPALEALGMLPPAQWKAAFLRAYNAIPAAKPVAPNARPSNVTAIAQPPAKPAGGQPLRANKTPSGESSAGPKNVGEAIEAALKSM